MAVAAWLAKATRRSKSLWSNFPLPPCLSTTTKVPMTPPFIPPSGGERGGGKGARAAFWICFFVPSFRSFRVLSISASPRRSTRLSSWSWSDMSGWLWRVTQPERPPSKGERLPTTEVAKPVQATASSSFFSQSTRLRIPPSACKRVAACWTMRFKSLSSSRVLATARVVSCRAESWASRLLVSS